MIEVADIFLKYGNQYIEKFGDRMPQSHQKAIKDIQECRTEELGGQVYKCDNCSEFHYSYHSCGNRSCPKCEGEKNQQWVVEQQKKILPVIYYHIVFTVPEEFRKIFLSNQKILYNILFDAVSYTLKKLGKDPEYLGAEISFYCLLHTWTRAMIYHPHVHCLVPGLGIDKNGCIVKAKENFLFPNKALSEIFRARFMHLAKIKLPKNIFPKSVWEKEWVVFIKSCKNRTRNVLLYLSRYIRKIAITNNRILSIDEYKVTFRYKENKTGKWKIITLSAFEFMRRFLQHVLPKGFRKIRCYGLFSPKKRNLLLQVQEELKNEHDENGIDENNFDNQSNYVKEKNLRCPYCKLGNLVLIGIIPNKKKFPFKKNSP